MRIGHLPPQKWNSPKVFVPILILLILLVVLAFFFNPLGAQSRFQRLMTVHNLTLHEKLWQTQNMASYQYRVFKRSDFQGEGSIVVVKNGAAIFPTENSYFDDSDTVPELFELIHEALKGRENGLTPSPDIVVVTYDRNFGYPTFIYFHYIKADYNTRSYEISKFEGRR